MPDPDDEEPSSDDELTERMRDASPEYAAAFGPVLRLTLDLHRHDGLIDLDKTLLTGGDPATTAAHLRGQADLLREASTMRLQLATALDDLATYIAGPPSDAD